jgi:hypothetical protein
LTMPMLKHWAPKVLSFWLSLQFTLKNLNEFNVSCNKLSQSSQGYHGNYQSAKLLVIDTFQYLYVYFYLFKKRTLHHNEKEKKIR